jgi:NADP-dependent 3-hydroxy acid dehydrogenase YdfG
MTYKLLPTLIARKGAIINLSSVAGSYPYPGGNVYGATKAFVRQFSLDLRSDLHATGVRVTSIEPGMAKTDFTLVRTGGDQAAADALYAGFEPLTADDLAETFYLLSFRRLRRRGIVDHFPGSSQRTCLPPEPGGGRKAAANFHFGMAESTHFVR